MRHDWSDELTCDEVGYGYDGGDDAPADEVCEVLERGFGPDGEMAGVTEYERHDSETERAPATEYSVLEALAVAFNVAMNGDEQQDAANVLDAFIAGFGAMLATLLAMANGRTDSDESDPVTLPEATVADINRHRQWDMDRELLGDEILATLGMSDPGAELRAAKAAIAKGAKAERERTLADLLAWADAMERVIMQTRATQWSAVSKVWCTAVIAKGKDVAAAYTAGKEAALAPQETGGEPDWTKLYLNGEQRGKFTDRTKALWETYRARKATVALQSKQERELKLKQGLERLRVASKERM